MTSSKWIFTANDGVSGDEVWITDGTVAGTRLLKDINTRAGYGSNASLFTDLGNGKLLFRASDAGDATAFGTELWVTDGTTGGTVLVKDLRPGNVSSTPSNIFSLGNGLAVLTAVGYGGSSEGELWVTDGTSSGTRLLKDIYAGSVGSSPLNFTSIGSGKAVFCAWDQQQGYEIWVTDGTTDGTLVLSELGYLNGIGAPSAFTDLGNGKVVFEGGSASYGREIWVSDGTVAGTKQIKDIVGGTGNFVMSNPVSLGNGLAVFVGNDGASGSEPWVTDGTVEGTKQLKDIVPGSGGSSAPMYAIGDGKALFAATNGTSHGQLWITDGTGPGTTLIKDFNVGLNSNPADFYTLPDGRVMFSAVTTTNGRELWVTDGTASGTLLIKDINSGSGSSNPSGFVSLGSGAVVFSADGGWPSMRELWITDGTAPGTMLVKDLTAGFGNSSILSNFSGAGDGQALFTMYPNKLWVTDGAETGTFQLQAFSGGNNSIGKMYLLRGSERHGSSGDDVLLGDGSPNEMLGFGGNDRFTGLAGDDSLQGGDGMDTAIYTGRHAHFVLRMAQANWVVDDESDTEGTDTLDSIERLAFDDAMLAFDADGNAGQVYRLYKSAFARTPDPAGLGGWINAMDNGATIDQVANAFVGSDEFKALYGADSSNDAFVMALYLNALGRAPAPSEIPGWVSQLANGSITRAQMLAQFSESTENKGAVAPSIANGVAYAANSEQATIASQGLTLTGTGNADSLFGSVGRDTLTGLAGNDALNGGANVDIAVYSSNRADYTISKTDAGHSVSSTAEGTDMLSNIERLQFADGVLAFDTSGNAGQVYRLYKAAFNRTPDTAGLTDWVKGADQGMTLQNIAKSFIASTEFQNLYGSNPGNDAFVTALYLNAIGRNPDEGGKAYWVTQLDNGLTKEMALIGFSESAENQAAVIGVIQNGIEMTLG